MYVQIAILLEPLVLKEHEIHDKDIIIFPENDECRNNVLLYEENSLSWLDRSKDMFKFDLVFVDGDHNYFTVSNELKKLRD